MTVMKRWLREPLVHFLLLGLAMFAISSAVNRGSASAPSRQIVLTLDDLRQLEIAFTAQWQRPPTRPEMIAMIENRIREEVLYREALEMGLDKDDTIVKRRMAQKMQFLSEDDAAAREPTARELRDWFAKNSRMFAQPPRVTFRHIYFSPDRRGQRVKSDAEQALGRFAGRPSDWSGASALGDPFMFQEYLADRAPDQVAREFGPAFARSLFEEIPGAWRGPIESGYGWHLVFVESLTPGREAAFEEVEPDVKTAWLSARKAEAWDKAFEKMRARYELVLPVPAAEKGGAPTATRTRTP